MKHIIPILIFWSFTISVSAQIMAGGNTDEAQTSYASQPDQDPIYLFANLDMGSLTVIPKVLPSVPEYVWYVYDGGSWNEDLISNSPEYTKVLGEKGYKVDVKDGGVVKESHVCWVFQPVINSVKIDTVSTNCSSVKMTSEIESKTLNYYDINTFVPLELLYNYNYEWIASPSQDLSEYNEPEPSLPSSVEKTTYSLKLDAFNNASAKESEAIEIHSIAVIANYTATITDREHENEVSSEGSYSAPVVTNFTDTSSGNITDREWVFFNTEIEGAEGIIGVDYDVANANFIFTEFGKYNAALRILNRDTGCEDTFMGTEINVIEMKVEVPNAFSPNDDGTHDVFLVKYNSVDQFKMVIVNRWGRKVYQTTNPGEGWDGNIGGRRASEGVYFYYITAEGFNEGESLQLKGPIHLIR